MLFAFSDTGAVTKEEARAAAIRKPPRLEALISIHDRL